MNYEHHESLLGVGVSLDLYPLSGYAHPSAALPPVNLYFVTLVWSTLLYKLPHRVFSFLGVVC